MTTRPSPDDLLLIGYFIGPHGVRGQLKLHAITNRPEHLQHVHTVYLGDAFTPHRLRHAALHKEPVMIVTLAGVDTRAAAEALKGQEVFILQQDAQPLDEDEYYLHDLPGMTVRTVAGDELGIVSDVMETGANEVLIVRRPQGDEVLIPMIKDVVKHLDLSSKVLVIEPLPGLLD